jgi:cell division septal protein FtsQ
MSAIGTGNTSPQRRWDYAYDRRRRTMTSSRRALRLPALRLEGVRPVPILLGLLGVLAVAFSLLLYNSALFKVNSVEVTGAQTLNTATIVELADAHGENIFTLDITRIEQRLEANPYIETAIVARDWPGGLNIVVIERVAVVLWQVGSHSFLVDAEGFVIGELQGEVPVGTVPVAAVVAQIPTAGSRIDAEVIDLLASLRTELPQRTGEQISSFEYSAGFGLTAILESGVRVVVGDAADYDYKLASLAALLREARGRGLAITEIDLRFGVSPVLR